MSQMSTDNHNQSNGNIDKSSNSGWVWGGANQTSTNNTDESKNITTSKIKPCSSSGGINSVLDTSVAPTPVKNVREFRWGFSTTSNDSTETQESKNNDKETANISNPINQSSESRASSGDVEIEDNKSSSNSPSKQETNASSNGSNGSNGFTFGVSNDNNGSCNTLNTDPSPFTFGITSSSNADETNTSNGSNGFTFGITSTSNNSNGSNGITFGISNETSTLNESNGINGITFGVTGDTNNEATNSNESNESNESENNTTNSTGTGWTFGIDTFSTAPTSTTTNNDDATTNSGGFTFQPTETSEPTTGFVFQPSNNTADSNGSNGSNGANNDPFSFQPSTTNSDPFAQFRTENAVNDPNPSTSDSPKNDLSQNSNVSNDSENRKPLVPPTPPPQPVINAADIDTAGMAAFLALYNEQNKDKWECPECSTFNANTKMICGACEKGQNPNAGSTPNGESMETTVDDNAEKSQFEYYEKLKSKGELLKYDAARHPKPKYWPYQHEEKEEELEQEGPEAWTQFDDIDSEDDEDVDVSNIDNGDNAEDINDETSEMVKAYEEYKLRRSVIKTQINSNLGGKKHKLSKKQKQNNKKNEKMKTIPKIQEDDVVIAMAGDGSMSGALGVGNGNVTSIKSNISAFPFLMTSLLGKKIKCAAAGIMSSAVVTMDDELYVWGLNDKSELTINPHNLVEVDVGCDDDQLSSKEGWKRLFAHYEQVLTAIYREHNPSKINDPLKPRFIATLLEKRKIGKLFMKFNGKTESHDGIHLLQDRVDQFTSLFEQKCRINAKSGNKKISKKAKLEKVEEVDVAASAAKIHEIYLKVCETYKIPEEERLAMYIPKATAKEMLQRKNRKLNPYKYLHEEEGGDCGDTEMVEKTKESATKETNGNKSDKMEEDASVEDASVKSVFEYQQKHDRRGDVDKRYEDAFQGGLACSYWTPAHIRLPFKMVIKQVTLGGTHMVVLDNVGRVFSSGTFSNDGPIGHHFDEEKDEVIRYQRELKQITNIEFIKYGDSNRRASNQSSLPPIKAIASGANHVLMLDDPGMVWQMGAVKLGQRWCERNIKKYLCPQRISLVNDKGRPKTEREEKGGRASKSGRGNRGKKVTFTKIACGNHHNLAISSDGQLYSWGQNVWLQCGHPKSQCGHGDVIDTPRWVPFYRTKHDVNDETEANEMVDYRVIDVVAGEHMTVALDIYGNVWSCGRNACYALGRRTRSEGIRMIGGQQVKTEVQPDLMRKVTDLEKMHVDWIGSGSVVWFAHNSKSGAVYSYGDASSGRAGIGQWKYARGRPVFDEYNLDLRKFEVTSANGGSDHVVFTIKRKKKELQRRQSMVPLSNSNSRESSVMDVITDRVSNLKTAGGDEKDDDSNMMDTSIIGPNGGGNGTTFRRFEVPQSVQPQRRKKNRKRTRNQMLSPVPIAEESVKDNDDGAGRVNKKPKLTKNEVVGGAEPRAMPQKANTTKPGFGGMRK